MTRTHARSQRGKRAYSFAPTKRRKSTNLIGAMTLEGVIASRFIDESVTSKGFIVFLKKDLCPVLKAGHIVLMDNSPTHIVKEVKELIESRGAKLIYLPPYSPEFNPIEHCWSKVKSCLRKLEIRDKKRMKPAVKKSLKTITTKDIQGWFRHCGYSDPPPLVECYNERLLNYLKL